MQNKANFYLYFFNQLETRTCDVTDISVQQRSTFSQILLIISVHVPTTHLSPEEI